MTWEWVAVPTVLIGSSLLGLWIGARLSDRHRGH